MVLEGSSPSSTALIYPHPAAPSFKSCAQQLQPGATPPEQIQPCQGSGSSPSITQSCHQPCTRGGSRFLGLDPLGGQPQRRPRAYVMGFTGHQLAAWLFPSQVRTFSFLLCGKVKQGQLQPSVIQPRRALAAALSSAAIFNL